MQASIHWHPGQTKSNCISNNSLSCHSSIIPTFYCPTICWNHRFTELSKKTEKKRFSFHTKLIFHFTTVKLFRSSTKHPWLSPRTYHFHLYCIRTSPTCSSSSCSTYFYKHTFSSSAYTTTCTTDYFCNGSIKQRDKLNSPTPFTRERKDLDDFLLEVKIYLKINNQIYDTDNKNIMFALSYMKEGIAALWKRAFLEA